MRDPITANPFADDPPSSNPTGIPGSAQNKATDKKEAPKTP